MKVVLSRGVREHPLKTHRSGLSRWLPLVFLIGCSTLLGSACRRQEDPPSPVLLQINDRRITQAEFEAEFERYLNTRGLASREGREDLRRAFLAQKIDRELILSAADRAGIALSPAVEEQIVAESLGDYPEEAFAAVLEEQGLSAEQWRRTLLENSRIEEAARQLAQSGARVSEEAIVAYYRQHADLFDRPPQVRVRQITVTGEAAGRRVLGQLRQGHEFAEAARRHSSSPDAAEGGDLGFVGRDQLPAAFDAVIFDLPVGRVSDLVQSEYGYHLFLVEEQRPARRLALDEVREEITGRLQADLEEQAYRDWLRGLRSGAAISVDWNLL